MSSSSSQNKEGIDIRKALEILSARSSSGHDHPHDGQHNDENQLAGDSIDSNNQTQCACHKDRSAPADGKNMGQVIDLDATASSEVVSQQHKTLEAVKQQLAQERSQRQAEIEKRFNSMTTRELLQAVLETQQQRVVTYRTYDEGLDVVLKTHNITNYPTICAQATATFSVLSDTINVIAKILAEQEKQSPSVKEVLILIRQLQQHEKQKLNLTAALHLERIREQSSRGADVHQDVSEIEGDRQPNSRGDERITRLLQEGVASLQGQIRSCVEKINEDIEELKCCVMEYQDD